MGDSILNEKDAVNDYCNDLEVVKFNTSSINRLKTPQNTMSENRTSSTAEVKSRMTKEQRQAVNAIVSR